MSATNSTTNYHFPIFIGTDIPSWLVDWNNAMNSLDSAIASAQKIATKANTDIEAVEANISTLTDTISSLSKNVSKNSNDITDITSNVNALTKTVSNVQAQVVQLDNDVKMAEKAVGTIYSGVVGENEDTISFNTPNLTELSLIDVYTDEFGVVPINITTNVITKIVTIKFETRSTALQVKVLVR